MRLGYALFYVPDVAATVAFYERCFALSRRFVDESGMYAEMETGATALAFADERLAAMNGIEIAPLRPAATPFGAELCLVADDPHTAYAQALAHGATAVKPPEAKPWGQIVGHVRDLNGLLVELCSAVAG
jgi:uncharacterized glyoxalase superfamily protein PhnB